MNQEALLLELLYRDIGREMAQQAQVVDMDYPTRAAAAVEEIYHILRQEHVDSRTRIRRIQSAMLRQGVFGPRPADPSAVESLDSYLRRRPEPEQAPEPVVVEKPRRGRPRKYPIPE